MAGRTRIPLFPTVSFRWRPGRRARTVGTLGLVILGPVLVLATLSALSLVRPGYSDSAVRILLLVDMVYVLGLVTLVLVQIGKLFAARRAKSEGSRLHLRLIGVFTLLAFLPTVAVAVFSVLTVNVGLEGWFSDRVQGVIGSSLAAAEAYKTEHRNDLAEDVALLAGILNDARRREFYLPEGELRQVLVDGVWPGDGRVRLSVRQVLAFGQEQVQRGLSEAYLIDSEGELRARGDRSYLFNYEPPGAEALERADSGELVIVEAWDQNEFRALLKLEEFFDRYLYVSRQVDGSILSLLDETQETARFYQQLERNRGRVLFEFGLLYLGFSVILVVAAIWLGLWYAERLSRPVGRLTTAAQSVARGNLDVQVPRSEERDEIGTLSRIFNEMVKELKVQRQSLIDKAGQIESRRRLFDSVLSSVTSGVIGLGRDGGIAFANRSAQDLLDWPSSERSDALETAVAEFAPMFAELYGGRTSTVQGEIEIIRKGRHRILLVRMAIRTGSDGSREGYVVAFDDITDLVSAQRTAAWGDVARRIAHEIKNPLTPIRLGAERISGKFASLLDKADEEALREMTDVIVRQTESLRRIVDEFSQFARLPEPDRGSVDLRQVVGDVALLQRAGLPEIGISVDMPDMSVVVEIDAAMIGQALTNLIKNSGESIRARRARGVPEGYRPRIDVALARDGNMARLTVTDNGIGLPPNRARLFEPYVTTREDGTGLGLPIVKKIIEEHGGTLVLEDVGVPDAESIRSARAVVRLPLCPERMGDMGGGDSSDGISVRESDIRAKR